MKDIRSKFHATVTPQSRVMTLFSDRPLLLGDFICRHKDGAWNGVPGDQFGEQTYIRSGKSGGGLVGLTLSQDQVNSWVLSQHVCNYLSILMENMFSNNHDEDSPEKHKEEGENRQLLDLNDRNILRKELSKYPHPLEVSAQYVVNIVNGCVASEKVNVADALSIGEEAYLNFKKNIFDKFHQKVEQKVYTMKIMQKGIQVGDKTIYNMEKLYARFLILSQKRNITLENLFSYELAPLPPSLFDENGLMRKSNKSKLTKKLEFISEDIPDIDYEIVDGNELLYHIQWPKSGSVSDLKEILLRTCTKSFPVYIIFDKYTHMSIKGYERNRRTKGSVYKNFDLRDNTPLPARDIIMNNTENKKKLIDLLCRKSAPNIEFIGENQSLFKHEEADVTIISYLFFLLQCSESDLNHIQIKSDDTDIFLLLLYYFHNQTPNIQISMKKFDGCVIDINKTAEKWERMCPNLLAIHALTGCDSTSYPYNKGKLQAIKILDKYSDIGLGLIGEISSSKQDVIDVGKTFFAHLYGSNESSTMNSLRHKIFLSSKSAPEIKTLPPTDEALTYHILRAHVQVLLWKSAMDISPPSLVITDWGWEREYDCLIPIIGVKEVAPPDLLKIVACGCSTQRPCSRNSCSCKSAGVSCTTFCKCLANQNCENCFTVSETYEEISDL